MPSKTVVVAASPEGVGGVLDAAEADDDVDEDDAAEAAEDGSGGECAGGCVAPSTGCVASLSTSRWTLAALSLLGGGGGRSARSMSALKTS